MSDIKLVSEEYTSKFVTGPALDQKLAQKQDKLQCYSESNGEVNILSNNIYINKWGIDIKYTANEEWYNILSTDAMEYISIGNQNNSIFFGGPLYDKDGIEITGGGGGNLRWYHESHESPYTVDIASNEVTLRSGSDTAGIIYEDTILQLNSTGVDIKTKAGGYTWRNILSTDLMGDISFGAPSTDISCCGTLYDKNGNEITGGGSKYISDDTAHNNLVLGRATNGSFANSIFVVGPICLADGAQLGAYGTGSIIADAYPAGMEIKIEAESTMSGDTAAITLFGELSSSITLQIGDQTCKLTADDLRKLREILNAHS